MQLLLALTLFVAGSLWLIFINLNGGTDTNSIFPAALLAGIGVLWYLCVRLLLFLRRR